ncbi:MAG: nitrous oxide reductase family maturation protein NosD [Candidatus Accumulibacter adjunctus]|uniref:Nitrous oxide reductase family maturation protein NosD n=1 Tax=Candidatus Accumulibacter adjunctus TaxID=1454001 RepID=A0A011NWP0_9PROT|nr:MAG: nitrous oxide reductase family maturation protein NosD [Candidatus Accumulibacter adjunctus]
MARRPPLFNLIRLVAPGMMLGLVAPAIVWSTVLAATLVVNPQHTDASDAGAGSRSQPLMTIAAAMKRLQPGDHVFIAAGVYREPILLPARSWAGNPRTLIEGDAQGRTLIKGSVIVDRWQPAGPGRFTVAIGYEPEQVFVDDQPLQQIGGSVFDGYPGRPDHPLVALHAGNGGIWPGRVDGDRESMPVNSFHYDRVLGNVMIRVAADSLAGHTVEVAALQRLALATGVERLSLKNLSFAHSNTTATTRGGAVQLDGRSIRIENVHIRRADGTCLGLNGADHEIISSNFSECGQTGLGGRGSGWKIVDVTVSRNNTRGFNKWWEAGGAKFVGDGGLNNSTITRFKATNNHGDGLWFDWKNRNNRVTDSLLAFNSGFGLHLEMCQGFLVDNNIVVGNRQRGIYLRQTSFSTLAFNLVVHNGLDGIAIVDEGQRDPRGEMDFSVRNNWVMGNVIAGNEIALTMPAPLADNRSDGNLFAGDGKASALRIGWNRKLAKADWIESGLDTHSEWLVLPMGQRREADVRQPLPEQLAWYGASRGRMGAVAAGSLAALAQRAPALKVGADARPGPAVSTWLPR